MTSYYRKYIQDFARLANPIVQLTKKESDFVWTDKAQSSFEILKAKLLEEPILTLPNQKDPFLLAIDFSYDGMGLVFSQI